MSIDEEIEVKRAELKRISATLELGLRDLHDLFRRKAILLCPLSIGTIVEFDRDRFGRVDRVGFHVAFMHELMPMADIEWTVSGRKVNRDGNLGRHEYHPVGPHTHNVTGTVFRRKDEPERVELPDRTPYFDTLASRRR